MLEAGVSGACKKIGSADPAAPVRNLGGPKIVENEGFEAGDRHRRFAGLVLLLLPLAEESGKEQTTHALTAQKAAGNQNAREPVILPATFLFFAALILFLVPLAEEMGKKQTTQAPTAQHATGN